MGRGHAHQKWHQDVAVSDVISCKRRDKMVCNHDIRERKFPGTKVSLSCFHFICGTLFMTHTYLMTLFCSSPLVIDDLPVHLTHHSNDKYRKMTLDYLSRTSCTHDLLPSGNVAHNVTHNVIDVASHSEYKSRHVNNRASVARAATSIPSQKDA
jgi:hypothetical protein